MATRFVNLSRGFLNPGNDATMEFIVTDNLSVDLWPSHSTRANGGWNYSAKDLRSYARQLLEVADFLEDLT